VKKRRFKQYRRLDALRRRVAVLSALCRDNDARVVLARQELWALYAQEQLLEAAAVKVGSLKPMCGGCLRRVYGIAKRGGWWCTNCECWIVSPKGRKKAGGRTRVEPVAR
jgi:hypothetical protein